MQTSHETAQTSSDHPLDAFFEPKAVAVVGARPEGGMGERVTRYLELGGFEGEIYRVNPRFAGQDGFCASLRDIAPGQVDLAIILVGARRVLDTLRDCAAIGVRAAIIGASGFAETGAVGVDLERQIREVARKGGVRLLGPNCLGLVNYRARLLATFATIATESFHTELENSKVALVSQSGALASYLVDLWAAEGLYIPFWVSTGNGLDVDVSDIIEYLADRPDINLIAVYLEGASDGRRFLKALRTARAAGKFVAVLKSGRSEAGANAVASHTASLAGEDAVYDAAIRDAGAVRVTSLQELTDLAKLTRYGDTTAGGVGIVTLSGGVGALMADACADAGLVLPQVPAEVASRLVTSVPDATASNPMDPTGIVASRPEVLAAFLDGMLSTPGVDTLVLFVGAPLADPKNAQTIAAALSEVRERIMGFVVVVGDPRSEVAATLRSARIVAMRDPIAAVRAIGVHRTWGELRWCGPERPQSGQNSAEQVEASAYVTLPEHEAKQILAAAGVRVPARVIIENESDIAAFTMGVAPPYVLKGMVEGIIHKTEAGLVHLNLDTHVEIEQAIERVLESGVKLGRDRPELLLEEMVHAGIDLLVDIRRDPVFGVVATVGAGGIYAEVERDAYIWVELPSYEKFLDGLSSLRIWPRINGYRGVEAGDVSALHELVQRVWALFDAGPGIREIEMNPVRLYPSGSVVLDAVVWQVPADADCDTPNLDPAFRRSLVRASRASHVLKE